jgi:hypothetical protein
MALEKQRDNTRYRGPMAFMVLDGSRLRFLGAPNPVVLPKSCAIV